MKRALAYFILSIFTLISLQQLVLLGAFFVNQDFIVEKFCINKDKPEMKCNGKCHLKDVISTNTEQQETQSTSVLAQIILPVFHSEYQVFFSNNFLVVEKIYASYNEVLKSTFNSKIFHPPQPYV